MKKVRILVYAPDKTQVYGHLLNANLSKEIKTTLDLCTNEGEARKAIPEADVLLAATTFPVHLLSFAKKLRWIQVLGAGVERFVEGGVPEGVIMTRVNVGFGSLIAEYVMAHLLSLTQKVRDFAKLQEAREWNQKEVAHICGETIGVAGVGAVGREVARIAKAFGMKVFGLDLQKDVHPAIDRSYIFAELRTFLKELKYLVICLPLTVRTTGMFGAAQFAEMRDDAVIVSTARGPIVVTQDLVEALRTGALGGAILDVFDNEPLPPDHPLWGVENVIITPHISGPSIPEDMVDFFVGNFDRFRKGERLKGCVDVERGF